MQPPTLGERIRVAREAAGLSQADLAERTGFHVQTVSRWERNLRTPDCRDLASLCRFLRLSADQLLGLVPAAPATARASAALSAVEGVLTRDLVGPGQATGAIDIQASHLAPRDEQIRLEFRLDGDPALVQLGLDALLSLRFPGVESPGQPGGVRHDLQDPRVVLPRVPGEPDELRLHVASPS